MPESLLPYSLTTVQRVKDRLGLTTTAHDALLLRLINSATDFIEGKCNRRFKETTYTNEMHSISGAHQNMVFLKNRPVIAIISAQYRAGTISNPQWTDFSTDDYELVENGAAGIVRFVNVPVLGINAVRFSYTAGYKIDFANYGDMTTHTLPADITELAERLVIRWFKRREAEGKSAESFAGGSVTWNSELTDEDKEILAKYVLIPSFV
jgi:hypothetical protein